MNDDISLLATWILGIMCAIPLLAAVAIDIWRGHTVTYEPGHEPWSPRPTKEIRKPWPWKIHIAITILSATAWLWSPWVALIGVKAYRANWNAVNYASRPDTVIPEPGKVIHAGEVRAEKP